MMEKYFANYNQALALKELGFDEPCMYAWCITVKYRVEQDGEFFLKTDGNPFGQFYKGQNFNKNYSSGQNKIQCSAPLKSQVFEFFRKNHKLRHNVMDFIDDITGIEWDYEIATIGTDLDENGNYIPLVDYSINDEIRKFKTYEEAESACIDKLIEIVKNE